MLYKLRSPGRPLSALVWHEQNTDQFFLHDVDNHQWVIRDNQLPRLVNPTHSPPEWVIGVRQRKRNFFQKNELSAHF